MLKTFFVSIVFVLMLASCSAYSDLNVKNLRSGMSQANVSETLGYSLVQTANSISVNGEHKEVFQVQKRIVRGGIARQQKYNLVFVENKLAEYYKDSDDLSF